MTSPWEEELEARCEEGDYQKKRDQEERVEEEEKEGSEPQEN